MDQGLAGPESCGQCGLLGEPVRLASALDPAPEYIPLFAAKSHDKHLPCVSKSPFSLF